MLFRSELEKKIVELAYAIKEIELENVNFEYYSEISCGVYNVHILEYRDCWQITNGCDGYANVPAKRDIYQMKFGEKKLTYKYSEEE